MFDGGTQHEVADVKEAPMPSRGERGTRDLQEREEARDLQGREEVRDLQEREEARDLQGREGGQ